MYVARPAFAEATAVQRASSGAGADDEWFINDGHAFVLPALADAWLRAVDNALAESGAARGVGDSCKSVTRLVCPDIETHRYDGLDTEHIRTTCRVLPCFGPVKVLGVFLGADGRWRCGRGPREDAS